MTTWLIHFQVAVIKAHDPFKLYKPWEVPLGQNPQILHWAKKKVCDTQDLQRKIWHIYIQKLLSRLITSYTYAHDEYLAQGHFNLWPGGAGNQITDPAVCA